MSSGLYKGIVETEFTRRGKTAAKCSALKERAAPSLPRRRLRMRGASPRLGLGTTRPLTAGTRSQRWVPTATTSLHRCPNTAQTYRTPAPLCPTPPVGRSTPLPARAGTPRLSTWAPCCLLRALPRQPAAARTLARPISSARAPAVFILLTAARGPL